MVSARPRRVELVPRHEIELHHDVGHHDIESDDEEEQHDGVHDREHDEEHVGTRTVYIRGDSATPGRSDSCSSVQRDAGSVRSPSRDSLGRVAPPSEGNVMDCLRRMDYIWRSRGHVGWYVLQDLMLFRSADGVIGETNTLPELDAIIDYLIGVGHEQRILSEWCQRRLLGAWWSYWLHCNKEEFKQHVKKEYKFRITLSEVAIMKRDNDGRGWSLVREKYKENQRRLQIARS